MNTKLLLFLFSFSIIFISCKNDDDTPEIPPIEQLPLATQTGADTLGCLIDGVPVIDNRVRNTFIQLVDGTYNFLVSGANDDRVLSVALFIDAWETPIIEGVYNISVGGLGKCSAYINYDNILGGIYTTTENAGILTITKIDDENSIVSGTFWFDVTHPDTGKTIEIREGRFDAIYLR